MPVVMPTVEGDAMARLENSAADCAAIWEAQPSLQYRTGSQQLGSNQVLRRPRLRHYCHPFFLYKS